MRRTALIGVGLALLMVGEARAEIFVVNQVTDVEDISLPDTPNACDVSSDPGSQCSLRAALQESNFTAGGDMVNFSIPGVQVHTLTPISPLPAITSPILIDGYTQPGASPNTAKFGKPLTTDIRIELDGTNSPALDEDGLFFGSGSGGSIVRGLAIGNWADAGIRVDDNLFIFAQGNFIGMDATGTVARPNVAGFSADNGKNSFVGGEDPAETNLISGNAVVGVAATERVTVFRNYIGTTRDPKMPAANGTVLPGPSVNLAGGEDHAVVENVIAFGGGTAVRVTENATAIIGKNRIFGHQSGLGIDIGPEGITPNDPGDLDGVQNFPVITSATRKRSKTKFKGVLDDSSGEPYVVQLFVADGNTRQGKRLLAEKQIASLPASGRFSISADKLAMGERVVATARPGVVAPTFETSEFSKPKKVKRAGRAARRDL